MFENLNPLINTLESTGIVLDGDKPIIQNSITEPLLVFILKMIIDTENYNTCRYCSALTSSGKNYCNPDHKERYRRNTPTGKLDNLLRQWNVGNTKHSINEKQKAILGRYGNYMLDHGFDYKTEVLPRIQKAKIKLLKEAY